MGTVWKRRDRDCWAVDYRDATSKRIRLTVATRKEADELLADKIKENKEPQLEVPSPPSILSVTV